MGTYSWQGVDADGKPTTGELMANNQTEVAATLQQQGITMTAVNKSETQQDNKKHHEDEASEADQKRLKKIHKMKVKNKELLLFTKKFTTMVKAGLPIIKTMEMLRDQIENPDFKLIVSQVLSDVSSGSTLSESFGNYPHIFDTVYINLLKAGESSGKLTTFLEKLTISIEKSEKIRSKFKSALMYPVILLFVAIGVIIIMMVKVVPVFVTMFSQMGGSLPAPTQLIVDISNFVRDPAGGGVLAIVLIAAFIGLKFLLRTKPSVKNKFDKYILKIPLIGEIIKMSTYAKAAMVQGNLNAAGVPVLESLDIVRDTMTNTLFIDAFDYVRKGINEGRPLSVLFNETGMFPPTFWQMLEVGEETGNMDDMFAAVAMFYEEEFDLIVDRMSEMLEPIMIVFMGTTIGFIIVAMYMPIFSMGSTISH